MKEGKQNCQNDTCGRGLTNVKKNERTSGSCSGMTTKCESAFV